MKLFFYSLTSLLMINYAWFIMWGHFYYSSPSSNSKLIVVRGVETDNERRTEVDTVLPTIRGENKID